MPLTPKQQLFVTEYIVDLNAAAAAARAGYSKRTARQAAAKLMANATIQAAILDAKSRRMEATEITAEWTLRRLVEEANYHGEGSTHGARVRALELVGKHLSLFEDRFRVVGVGGNDEPTPFERRVLEFRKRYAGSRFTPTFARRSKNGLAVK